MTNVAFKATYSDWKPVKSRRVIQVVFEVPWEKHDEAYQALGGMCDPGKERWFGIARLTEGKEGEAPAQCITNNADTPPRLDSNASAGAERGHKSPAQVAGYLCTLPSFHKFLREKFADTWHHNIRDYASAEEVAKETLYDICAVTSRRELTDKNTEWHALQLAFRLWQNHPELEDA